MKKIATLLTALVLAIAAEAQTLNVRTGSVTYQFPAAQTGDMTYADARMPAKKSFTKLAPIMVSPVTTPLYSRMVWPSMVGVVDKIIVLFDY